MNLGSPAVSQQHAPIKNDRIPVVDALCWELWSYPDISIPPSLKQLLDDLQARKQLGIDRYGVALQSHNGRDHKIDFYQELLDSLIYAYAEWEESRDPYWLGLFHRLVEIAIEVREKKLAKEIKQESAK